MVTQGDIRTVALSLPRTEEALVWDQVKFRVGRIVYVALSRDELSMGFGLSAVTNAQPIRGSSQPWQPPSASPLAVQWSVAARRGRLVGSGRWQSRGAVDTCRPLPFRHGDFGLNPA
jgi:hypothetical protein